MVSPSPYLDPGSGPRKWTTGSSFTFSTVTHTPRVRLSSPSVTTNPRVKGSVHWSKVASRRSPSTVMSGWRAMTVRSSCSSLASEMCSERSKENRRPSTTCQLSSSGASGGALTRVTTYVPVVTWFPHPSSMVNSM